ncbi:putative nrd1 protein [Phaeoacremonium minimum UCRPA7]|uniref:Putative nrd1 protein n=1 Tax=Phaeoacremonium minimum (strain UCR-PA7) TaxID=1286976 RepID=R8BLC1_PHAM7|nr:putative nrd1 protein [Phaeoacremonium minimum UCRPA7]EOO00060.1 putative nrd1 protein [Phaeoacremonium minimum UCRPA7]
MSSAVAELETGLQAMLALKPPGVSGSKINAITTLCVANVQSESVLIQKIYTHFKKTPGTHKLGVLYVVDSVTRKWMDQAKQQGQVVSSAAQDGTYGAGVHRVTELMPVLMNDIISSAPEDQKEKIKKLVDIWEKGQTFPPKMLESFKEKLSAPPPPSNLANGFLGNAPAAQAGGSDPNLQKNLMLIQTLLAQGIPVDKISTIIGQLTGNNAAPQAPLPQVPQPSQSSYSVPPGAGWDAPRTEDPRDRNGYHDSIRSPNRARGRSRSRSPGRHWDAHDSPRGRDERRFGDFGRNSPGRGRLDDRDRGRGRGSDYRQRSPPGHGSPQGDISALQEHKWVEYDSSIPNGHIKVLSRTLFVGGVTCSEAELRNIFNRYGEVQTCIVNKEKRHAFVKMYTRKDAMSAKEGMEDSRSTDMQLRTRWGVGFGPRDCSDYQTGISVIPISKLTEADRKWMLTAPYGGSGGKPIVTGLVVEEPDIEIGAGVSSKAISRRMQTDKGGSNGPKSSRRDSDDNTPTNNSGGHFGGRHGRRGGGRDNRRDDNIGDSKAHDAQSAVPGFPFGLAIGPNGMPIFPPGFSFPAPESATTNPPY